MTASSDGTTAGTTAARPAIVTVDDDPEVLGAVERDLRSQYGDTYRIMPVASGPQALDVVQRLLARGTPLALVVADERMPEMSGTELLAELKRLAPTARTVLLTAYADTEAAIRGINDVGLDHYLMKPWDPPDLHLYPVLDDLLFDWAAHAEPPLDGLRVAGSRWSAACFTVKDFLSRNQVRYRWIDLDEDKPTRALVDGVSEGLSRLPVVILPDGSMHAAPSQRELAELAGLQTIAKLPFYDVVIVGGGPAGLAASVYAASEGLHAIVVEEGAHGGQAGTSSRIENYLGFPAGLSGADLANRATVQARRFGAELLSATGVVGIRREDPYRLVVLGDGSELSCYTVILSMGVSVRRLEADGAEEFAGAGVYYGAALTEAAACRDKSVVVVGAGNSAGQGALFYSRYAARTTIAVRGSSLSASMSAYLTDRIEAEPSIEVVTGVEVAAIQGNASVERVCLRSIADGGIEERAADAVFVFIGAAPHTAFLGDLVDVDDKGFELTGPQLPRRAGRPRGWTLARDPFLYETNVPGIFAVGDVRSGSGKRVAAAVGEGSGAVGLVHAYLDTV
jgi:thioredoxin reductase (NADPH)